MNRFEAHNIEKAKIARHYLKIAKERGVRFLNRHLEKFSRQFDSRIEISSLKDALDITYSYRIKFSEDQTEILETSLDEMFRGYVNRPIFKMIPRADNWMSGYVTIPFSVDKNLKGEE